MSLPSSWVMVCVVLVGSAAPAQELAGGRRKMEQVIVLKEDEKQTSHVLRLAPGTATLVLFDPLLLRGSVDTRALQTFERAEVTERSLVLRPAEELNPDAPLNLTVRFADGESPQQMELTLTSEPGVVDTQVEVRRGSESKARLAAELVKLRGLCAATEAGLAPLRARCARAGLAGLFISGEMDSEEGVRAHSPTTWPAELGLRQKQVTIFRMRGTVMVGAQLENPAGGAPWMAGPARLVRLDARGQPLEEARSLHVLMEPERLAPGGTAWVAVQWEESLDAPATAVQLEVADAVGRGLRWERLELQPPVVVVPQALRGERVGP
jgi:uncharacterized protein (TIGR02268 family)